SALAGVPGDNLGNHTAMQNINLNGNYLSGDGDNEGIFVTSTGSVGMGTSNPQTRLHINGSSAQIRLQSPANPVIQFYDASTAKAVMGWHASENLLKLNAQGNLSNSAGINISPSGKVGINTESPASILDVNGTVTATAFVGDGSGLTGTGDGLGNHTATQTLDLANNDITNGGTVTAAAFVGDGSSLTGTGDDLGNHTATQNITLGGNYLSGDGNSEGIYVDANGNVGIGTNTP
ncbi:MAG: hypothetical protein KDD14_25980, partial [Saprospiraceae bacterium]|nr:hypothetical protein [Saprospiraceae bacterium]